MRQNGGTQVLHPHPRAVPRDPVDDGLALVDLHLPFADLRRLAPEEAAAGRWLDAFLLAAAAGQVLDDHLHHAKSWPKRLHEQLRFSGRPALVRAGRGVRAGLDLAGALRTRRPGDRRRIRSREALYDLTVDLAALALAPVPDDAELTDRLRRVLGDDGPWTPDLDQTVLVLPSAFRSFDQHPRDLVALARAVADAHPDRQVPVAVFGVRTSGSYLGPLLAAALRAEGYVDVTFGAVRPDDHLDHAQRTMVRSVGRGLAVLVDDPPVSGESLAESAALLADPGHVVVALAVDDPAGRVPPALQHEDVVVLPVDGWHLPTLLTTDAVRATLQGLLGPEVDVVAVTPVPWPCPAGPDSPSTAHRAHRRAAFTVDLVDGGPRTRTLLVESTGQGFLGRHNRAVAERLAGRVPESIGFVDGLHLQWLPDGATASPVTADAVVDHLLARHRALAVEVDPSAGFEGRQSVVEVATELLAGALGPLGPAARLRVVAPAVRRVLRPTRPAVVDGRVTLDRFLTGGDGEVVKLDAADGAFSHKDLATYDAAFDVAQTAETPIGHEVRTAWEAEAGAIAPERWLLHRLVHRWDRVRHHQLTPAEAERITARSLQDYLAETVLDIEAPADGPWVALDVDGVLEGPVLGASSPGRTGATALRALLAHGHRVALVTGRSVADVVDRVSAWGLAAGVAEYGTALVVAGEAVDLRSADDRRVVEALREQLTALDGVEVDGEHTHAVRAVATGRVGLSDAQLDRLDLDGVVVVPGEGQTDFVPAGCSKALGFEALRDRLDPDGSLALAVGDGPADLDLLDRADRAFLPRHAAALARPRHQVGAHAYQGGLADAVADLLGHRPGACRVCVVHLDADARFVLAVLSLREAGARGLPGRLLAVGAAARRAGKPEERPAGQP